MIPANMRSMDKLTLQVLMLAFFSCILFHHIAAASLAENDNKSPIKDNDTPVEDKTETKENDEGPDKDSTEGLMLNTTTTSSVTSISSEGALSDNTIGKDGTNIIENEKEEDIPKTDDKPDGEINAVEDDISKSDDNGLDGETAENENSESDGADTNNGEEEEQDDDDKDDEDEEEYSEEEYDDDDYQDDDYDEDDFYDDDVDDEDLYDGPSGMTPLQMYIKDQKREPLRLPWE